MLQQTRVETVIPYYREFLRRFPSIEDLAPAPEAEVLTAWSGLGYYSRARNLHRSAKHMAAHGIPANYEDVLSLPGVGPYTAAAIASIALGLPHAAVDGNVIRVISRLTNDASEITAQAARRRFQEEAARLMDPARPGDFNQAMMELGATVCLPGNPDCAKCPVAKFCQARAAGTERELPVKISKARARDVRLEVAIHEHNARIFLIRRPSGEKRLADFWELPAKSQLNGRRGRKATEFRHQIVNDRFRVTVWHFRRREAESPELDDPELESGVWIALTELDRIPLTTITRKALAAIIPEYRGR